MRKISILILVLISMFMFNYNAKADTTVDFIPTDFKKLTDVAGACSHYDDLYYYSNFESFISDSKNKQIFDDLYNELKKEYQEKYSTDHPYYTISVSIISNGSKNLNLYSLILTMFISDDVNYVHHPWGSNTYKHKTIYNKYQDGTYYTVSDKTPSACNRSDILVDIYTSFSKLNSSSSWRYTPLALFETNSITDLTIGQHYENDGYLTFNIYDSNAQLKETYTSDDKYPVYYPNGYSSVIDSSYKTVNLNNYSHVYLIPKNYDIDPFSTKLSVKGKICLSAQYGYGEKEKENGVSDYCTKIYDDYTDIDFYVPEVDLKNKAIYLIEPRDTSTDNYFKYDSSLFDIAYISNEDRNNPKITIDGKTYYPIGPDNLTSSAKKNEEEGIIPGASCTLGDLNCHVNTPHKQSLSDIVDNAMNTLSSFWNSFLSFMSLVTKCFNALPTEIRAISITTFTVGCVLGLIKIIKS